MSRFHGTYPDNWRAIAKQIKDENAWKCIRCGHPHDPASGHTLTIHHADNDKSNCAWFNLLCLCQRCHLSIQGKVIMDRPWLFEHSEWFRPYAGGFFALKYLGLIPQQQRTIHERPQAAARDGSGRVALYTLLGQRSLSQRRGLCPSGI